MVFNIRELGWPSRLATYHSSKYLAIFFQAGATLYAVFAFRNFSSFEVLSAVLLFSALPLGLILMTPKVNTYAHISQSRVGALMPVLVAPIMFLIQFSGFRLWWSYFSNFPNHRMVSEEPGFDGDSALHVAIIQGILNTGRPTTGQHLEPWASYHALSHYVDAIALFFLGLDPWESYALLFFAKGVAISLAVIYFSMKVAQGRPEALFWVTLLIVYPAFTATWHIIGSHAQWFPMILLALVSYRVFVIGTKEHQSWKDYLLLTVLVVVFSFGKVSIGFAFALIVGLWLFFRRPLDLRVTGVGVVWVAFLGIYSLVFSSRFSTGPISLWTLFGDSWPEIFALILISIALAIFSQLSRMKYGGTFLSAVIVSVAITAVVALIATGNRNDVFYFFHGLFSVATFLSVAVAATALFSAEGIPAPKERVNGNSLKMVAFAGALLFAFSPVTARADLSPYSDGATMRAIVGSINTHTYDWFNRGSEPGEHMSVWKALNGKPLRAEVYNEKPWLTHLRDSLHQFVDAQDISDDSPVLFLTAEQFEFVSSKISPPSPRFTGLALTAVTGVPLIFGILDLSWPHYGWEDYPKDSEILPESKVTEAILCGFDRPVIVVTEIEELNFELLCTY